MKHGLIDYYSNELAVPYEKNECETVKHFIRAGRYSTPSPDSVKYKILAG